MRYLLFAGLLLAASPTLAQSAPESAATGAPVGPDAALLRGLLWASEPTPEEIRAMAIEDLALLGDPRALNPLATLLWDPNPRVQAAALRAVALFQHPRAEEILSAVVRHPKLPDTLKIQALDGLLYQRTASARATVEAASKDPRLPLAIQSAALNVAARWGGPRQ
ncbi:HEAT repeat domain-containing protein [Hyalangium rubrum]|uniref:HEAT repeat domain-containing protein n=1 Tax=Hyalangium rubrum TaxID=3103134 RepID=A0ABU5HFM2_9BACT|nr:HEAT repeat domain-containing protein [Hyalangium sp. s54d21]MDY7230860.1 HEAT repeat domain-containing protein [Hyalangium sp. s54d21]